MPTTTTDLLTVGDAVSLGMLLQACQQGQPVTWLVRYPDTGELHPDGLTLSGIARAIVSERDGRSFLRVDQDVRDGYVWISCTFEHFLPVRDVLKWMHDGTFACNYRP